MPWNGSGDFSRQDGSGATGAATWNESNAAGRTTITTALHDAHDQDLATGINTCLTKDGQNAATADLPMGGFNHTNVGNASARSEYAAAGQVQDGSFRYAADSGTADAMAITLSPAITAYAAGQVFYVKAAAANTGATTINVNTVGAKNVFRGDTSLAAGDIQANGMYALAYDGTQFQIIGPVLDIQGLTTESTLADGDLVPVYDASATANRAFTRSNLLRDRIKTGTHTVWVPATSMSPRSTNGPARSTTELATNDVMLETLDFDPATIEAAQFSIWMPNSWDEGAMTVRFCWTFASASNLRQVQWAAACRAYGDDDAIDQVISGAQTVIDTAIAANDEHHSSATGAVTPAGTAAEGDRLIFNVFRNASSGADSLSVDAQLIGVQILMGIDEVNDE